MPYFALVQCLCVPLQVLRTITKELSHMSLNREKWPVFQVVAELYFPFLITSFFIQLVTLDSDYIYCFDIVPHGSHYCPRLVAYTILDCSLPIFTLLPPLWHKRCYSEIAFTHTHSLSLSLSPSLLISSIVTSLTWSLLYWLYDYTVRYPLKALVPNTLGLERALKAGADEVI